MTFNEKVRRRYEKTTPEFKGFAEEFLSVISKTDAGFGAFIYADKMFTLPPPESKELGYLLVAAQITVLSQAYEKSPTVILSEVADALKFLKEMERNAKLSGKLGGGKKATIGVNAGQG